MQPKIKASMYFAFGRSRRGGVRSATTFAAILAGERTSTTRFAVWPGHARWQGVREGDVVRFFEDREMRGASVDVVVTADPVEVDLAACDEATLEAWSLAEGWSREAGRGFGAKNGVGLQVRYRLA